MSTVATRPPSADRLALVESQLAAVLETPLRLLPREVRPAALRVWTCHRHLAGMESPVSLAALLAVWIDEHDLHPDDAAAALKRMLAPESVGRHKFASDLTTDLAAEVATAIRRRKLAKDQDERRTPEEREKIRQTADLLAGIGRDPRS